MISYLKLIPIRPWDDNYNISVWFINLKGIDDEIIIKNAVEKFNFQKDKEKKLKWLRLTREIFKEKSIEILKLNEINQLMHVLENPNITKIFEFIMKGEYEKAIKVLNKIQKINYFDSFIKEHPYKIFFRKVDFINDEVHNIFIKAKINNNMVNHFQLNRESSDEENSSKCSLENREITKKKNSKLLNHTILKSLKILHLNGSDNFCDYIVEEKDKQNNVLAQNNEENCLKNLSMGNEHFINHSANNERIRTFSIINELDNIVNNIGNNQNNFNSNNTN